MPSTYRLPTRLLRCYAGPVVRVLLIEPRLLAHVILLTRHTTPSVLPFLYSRYPHTLSGAGGYLVFSPNRIVCISYTLFLRRAAYLNHNVSFLLVDISLQGRLVLSCIYL